VDGDIAREHDRARHQDQSVAKREWGHYR
jgi:hypothetical protein